jgi:hypothetical protein
MERDPLLDLGKQKLLELRSQLESVILNPVAIPLNTSRKFQPVIVS